MLSVRHVADEYLMRKLHIWFGSQVILLYIFRLEPCMPSTLWMLQYATLLQNSVVPQMRQLGPPPSKQAIM